MRRLHGRSRCARSSAGDRPEEFANFNRAADEPNRARSFQLLVGGFQLLVGGD